MRQTEFKCEQCGKMFSSMKADKNRVPKFCSRICASVRIRKMKTCITCGKEFYNWQNKEFCSMKCWGKFRQGKPLSLAHRMKLSAIKKSNPEFYTKQMHTPKVWAKISAALTGKARPWNANENHHDWKGDNAGYTAFHAWLRRNFGRAAKCEHKSNRPSHLHPKRFEWALIHGEQHGHFRERYKQLCSSCHRIYDNQQVLI